MEQGRHDIECLDRFIQMMNAAPVEALVKGLPDFAGRYADVAKQGFHLGAGDLPLPVGLVRDSAVSGNRAWMRRFLDLAGVDIAPHGKTTMAPEVLHAQIEDGAWGITAATAQHAAFYARIGIRRILLANQLVGDANIRLMRAALDAAPGTELYVLVDNVENARLLSDGPELNVILEIGLLGGRTGVRDANAALGLAREIASLPGLRLSGVGAYEGIVAGVQADREATVSALMTRLRETTTACADEGLFATPEIIVTAGGSEFFDLVGDGLTDWPELGLPVRPVIRSGCYIMHDSIAYDRAFDRLLERSGTARAVGDRLVPAVEVWAAVQSRPEPGLAFATLGKRDVSFDWDMPAPVKWWPRGAAAPQLLTGYRTLKLNDQHAYLEIPADSPIAVGDMIGFGISHVCTTFDKWRCLLTVDDEYRVTGTLRTFF